MLDFHSSRQTTKYALGTFDEVVIDGVSYRPQSRRDWGYIFMRSDGTGVAESFDHGKISHLVQKGQLTHRPDAFLPENMRARQTSDSEMLSALDGKQATMLAVRLAFVEAFLDLETLGAVRRTDVSMHLSMFKLQRRAMEILSDRPSTRGQAGRRAEAVQPPSPSALRRWLRSYEAHGAIGLCDAKHRSGNRSARMGLAELALMGPIIAQFASSLRPTVKLIYEKVCMAFDAANEKRAAEGVAPLVKPSRETVRQRIKALDPYQTCLAREGAAVARKKFAPVARGLELTRPLERVEIDEWKVDLMSILAKIGLLEHLSEQEKADLGYGKKKLRWMLTVAICATTQCIVGMRLSPSATKHSAIQTLEMVTQDKGVWSDLYGANSAWNMAGVPELVVTDNGSAFISAEMRLAMADLGIRSERTPAGFPEMRARIERLFGTMATGLLPLLSGRTFSDVVAKGDADPEKSAALTQDEFAAVLVRWIVDIYHKSPHEGLDGETPANCWNRLADDYGVRPAPDTRRRRLVFGTRDTRVLSKKGIRFYGVWYHSDVLAEHMLRSSQRKLDVRWHQDDIGAIEVKLDDGWVEVPAVMTGLRGVRADTWYHTVRSLRARYRDQAAVSRSVVLQAIRDIEALNENAMKREGLVAVDWSPESIAKIEDRILMGFDVADTDDVPAMAGGYGMSLKSRVSNPAFHSSEPQDVVPQPNPAPDRAVDNQGDDDGWANTSK